MLEVGQRWRFLGGGQMILSIQKIEELRGAKIAHISILEVPGEKVKMFGHLPWSYEAVENSVTDLIDNAGEKTVGFEDGYRQWRGEFDANRAGVFDIDVGEMVTGMVDQIEGSIEGDGCCPHCNAGPDEQEWTVSPDEDVTSTEAFLPDESDDSDDEVSGD